MQGCKRYRIEFSGKAFPEYYPHAMTIGAPDKERAREWADEQLKAWEVSSNKVRVVVTEYLAPVDDVEVVEQPAKKPRKKGIKRGSI